MRFSFSLNKTKKLLHECSIEPKLQVFPLSFQCAQPPIKPSEMVANGAAAAASLRRRRTGGGGGGGSSAGGASSTMLQFYTEDTPGLRLSPNVVLIMSIGFIAFVGALHVLGKLYRVPSSS